MHKGRLGPLSLKMNMLSTTALQGGIRYRANVQEFRDRWWLIVSKLPIHADGERTGVNKGRNSSVNDECILVCFIALGHEHFNLHIDSLVCLRLQMEVELWCFILSSLPIVCVTIHPIFPIPCLHRLFKASFMTGMTVRIFQPEYFQWDLGNSVKGFQFLERRFLQRFAEI